MARKSNGARLSRETENLRLEKEAAQVREKIGEIRDGPASRLEKTKQINFLRDKLRHLQNDLDDL